MSQNWVSFSSCALPVFLEALDGLPHQLREGCEIPIGITHVDMTEIRRQGGKKLLYLEATSVPVQQGLHGEAMLRSIRQQRRRRYLRAGVDCALMASKAAHPA